MSFAVGGCATARRYNLPSAKADGFMQCAERALRVQLRYDVTKPKPTVLVATRATGDRQGRIIISSAGRGGRRELEVRPDGVPGSDRDALIRRCERYLK